ncbi:trypsin-like peptidase domain-containing protein [Candidatus Bipolaricaulota bacterium]|nr:trypsin-like peptidase domain-containing protein [Candidatus Bipolaricaulota bacterium]
MTQSLRRSVGALLLALFIGWSVHGQVIELQEQLVSVFQLASPAVVYITVKGTTEDRFMRRVPFSASGTGFLIDTEGNIVTNYHVIENADEIIVAFNHVECCSAEVIGTDPSTDLAVIRVNKTDLPPPLELADSDQLRVGEFVVSIGNPFGLNQTMTLGIVSALERTIQSPDGRFVGEAIQTDASINPGNSGGPLLNLDGHVVGVTSQIISPVAASVGIAFAISSNTVARVVPELIENGSYPHSYLGISGFALTPDILQLFRDDGITVPADGGILVTSVVGDGPADLAGIRIGTELIQVGGAYVYLGGDVLVAIDDHPIHSIADLVTFLDIETRVGDVVHMTIVRDGSELTLAAVLQQRPSD